MDINRKIKKKKILRKDFINYDELVEKILVSKLKYILFSSCIFNL